MESSEERLKRILEETAESMARLAALAPKESPSAAGEPPVDEVQDLATEEAAIEAAAEDLKRQRELDRELAKFTAAAFDRASTSLLTLGLVGPGVGFLYHTNLLAGLTNPDLVLATISCLGLAFVLHWVGRAILKEVFLR